MNPQLLYDANAIYRLIRETPQNAITKLSEGSTIQLVYYELGNALWRESTLLKRISPQEAKETLNFMYTVLQGMQVASLDSESGTLVLELAGELNLTFYDSAYLTEAKKSGKILVTEDKKLAKAAEKIGVKTIPSISLANNP
jgi:predicted nucleic acid-binding protein